MYNRRYEKVFLMLRQENAGYAYGQKQPWGSCVMELKNGGGRLSISVQELRQRENGYAVYVLGAKEGTHHSIFCGRLYPDHFGKSTFRWDFSPDDVAKTTLRAEQLHTVAIVAEEKAGQPSAPLSAFFSEKTEWKAHFQPMVEQIKQKDGLSAAERTAVVLQEAPVAKPDLQEEKANPVFGQKPASAPSLPTQESEKQKEEGALTGAHGNFRTLLRAFRKELQELQDTGVFSKQETEKILQAGNTEVIRQEEAKAQAQPESEKSLQAAEEAQVQPILTKEEISQPQKMHKTTEGKEAETTKDNVTQTQQVLELFRDNQPIYPFGETMYYCVGLKELPLLPQYRTIWQHDLFFLQAQAKYRHFVLGQEDGALIFGVPDTEEAANAVYAKALGFTEFRPMLPLMAAETKAGYWIKKIAQAEPQKKQ